MKDKKDLWFMIPIAVIAFMMVFVTFFSIFGG